MQLKNTLQNPGIVTSEAEVEGKIGEIIMSQKRFAGRIVR